VYVIDFGSHKLRRVARSTKAVETLTAYEGNERAFYCHSVAVWMSSRLFSGMLPVLDNSIYISKLVHLALPKKSVSRWILPCFGKPSNLVLCVE
jgi:hypothetical protein